MQLKKDIQYQLAKERVTLVQGFYHNLITYLIVIPVLVYLNVTTTTFLWFWFPALGWGIGLALQALRAFGALPFLSKEWETRKVVQLMNEYKNDYRTNIGH